MPQKVTPPSRFWIVRKPDSSGTVVAKMDTKDADKVEIPDSCVAYSVSDRAALENHTTDPSVLTESEREVLGILP